MQIGKANLELNVKVNMSLWDAIKCRISGIEYLKKLETTKNPIEISSKLK